MTDRDAAYFLAAQNECPRCGIPCRCHLRRPTIGEEVRENASITVVAKQWEEFRLALRASQRCGIREGETLAELITRLYAETLADKP